MWLIVPFRRIPLLITRCFLFVIHYRKSKSFKIFLFANNFQQNHLVALFCSLNTADQLKNCWELGSVLRAAAVQCCCYRPLHYSWSLWRVLSFSSSSILLSLEPQKSFQWFSYRATSLADLPKKSLVQTVSWKRVELIVMWKNSWNWNMSAPREMCKQNRYFLLRLPFLSSVFLWPFFWWTKILGNCCTRMTYLQVWNLM